MSADKIQGVNEALADLFNVSTLNTNNTETARGTLDHETLSEAFREPHLNVANTEQSFARFDHAALKGIFGAPPTERPSPTSFDQSVSDIVSGRPPLASDTQQPPPGFDQSFAEILRESPQASTNTTPSQLSFDHQALAALQAKSRAEINPPTSPLSSDTEHALFSGQIENEEPVKKASAAAPTNEAESARPPRAKSILAKLHHIFSTKEPLLFVVSKVPFPAALAGQRHTPEPIAKAISTPAEDALPQPANSLLAGLSTLVFEQEPTSPPLASQPGSVRATEDIVATFATDNACTRSPQTKLPPQISTVTEIPLKTESSQPILSGQSDFAAASTDAESAPARQANSFSVELPPFNPIASKISPDIRQETSHPALSGQGDNLGSAAELAATAPPTETKPARPQEAGSYLAEVPPLLSTDIAPSFPNFQGQPSAPILSGRLETPASTVSTVTPFPPANPERARPHRSRRLLAELTPTISTSPKPSLPTSERERSTSFTQLMNVEPVEKTASIVTLTQSESAVLPPQAKRVPGEIVFPLHPTDTELQPFIFENESSPKSGQPDHAEPAVEIVSAAPLPEAEDARTRQSGAFLADLPPSRSSFERKPLGPAVETVAMAHAATAQQTRSSPQNDLPAAAPVHTPSSLSSFSFKQDLSSSSPSGQPASVRPLVNSVEAAGLTEAEGGGPHHISSLLAAFRGLIPKPSSPIVGKEPSRSTLGSQPDFAGIVETIVDPLESAFAPQTRSLPTQMPSAKSSAPIFEKERSHPAVSDQPLVYNQPTDAAPMAKADVVAPPADTESVVTRAQQAKSLLAELDLDTAIHLRWVMRDIRGQRTKFSPVSADDLTALMQLGLVEMREGQPRLTGLGVFALD